MDRRLNRIRSQYLLATIQAQKMVFDCCLKIRRLLASNHTYPDPYQCPNLTTLTVVLPFLWQRSQRQVIQTCHPLLPHSQPLKSPHFPPQTFARHVCLLILSTALQILHLLTRLKQSFLLKPLVSFLTCRLALSWNKALTVIQLDHKYQTLPPMHRSHLNVWPSTCIYTNYCLSWCTAVWYHWSW